MIIISAHDLCLSYGTDVILENISFGINEGDKVGVVGVNGAGKSMLLKMLNGIIQQTSGEIFVASNKKLGFLEQNAAINSKKTLYCEMLEPFEALIKIEQRMAVLEQEMKNVLLSDNENMRNAKEYTLLEEQFKSNGGYEYKSRIKSTLCGIGFEASRHDDSVETLSGGQKTRLALAKTLLCDPDILILDEPTNHLDIETVQWLEDYLKGFKKTLITVSHDRYFLDKITNKTLEIENKQSKLYSCSYSEYVKRKEQDRKADLKHYELQQKEIARMEAFIENQRKWNREKNIIAAESRMKAIERMEKIEKPKNLPSQVSFSFSAGDNRLLSDRLVTVKDISKRFSQKVLFDKISFTVKAGQKLFVYGPNGAGKSTLLKILCAREQADSGAFEYAKGLKIGYYDQEHQGLNGDNTVIDELWNSYPNKKQSEIRGALARFLFKADDVFKKVGVLSGGEKARLTFAKLMLDSAGLLILDEPTNHLDIPSREVLEQALSDYDGTIIAVSHDRYFINKLADSILSLDGQGASFEYKGTYEQYLEYVGKKVSEQQKGTSDIRKGNSTDFERAKKEKSERRRIEKTIENCESEILQIEKELNCLAHDIENNATNFEKLTALYEQVSQKEEKLEQLYLQYDRATNQKNAFENN